MIMTSSVTVPSADVKEAISRCRIVIENSRSRVMAELYVEHRRRLTRMGTFSRFIERLTSTQTRRYKRDCVLETIVHDRYDAHLDALESMANVSDTVNLSYESLVALGYFARVKGVD